MSEQTASDASSIARPDVCAVIVTYNPDVAVFLRLVESVSAQVGKIVVFDNSVDASWRNAFSGQLPDGLEFHGHGENLGIATGFNFGIRYARDNGFGYVLLSDQDSLPAPDMVSQLLSADDRLTRRGEKVAAVGPCFADPRSGKLAQIVELGPWKYRLVDPDLKRDCLPVFSIISSGMLICLDRLEAIGGVMRDDFFIDMVDIEWCMRARRRGYASYMVTAARMLHTIGDNLEGVRGSAIYTFQQHSPLRLYYQFRNAFYMYLYCKAPLRWIQNDCYSRLVIVYIYLFSTKTPFTYLKSLLRGVLDGVTARLGRR